MTTTASDVHGKLTAILEAGRERVPAVLQQMDDEFERRRDLLVDPRQIEYDVNGGVTMRVPLTDMAAAGREPVGLTDFSRRQLFDRLGMPSRFADDLFEAAHPPAGEGAWATQLLETNLRALSDNNVNGKRLLLRVVDGKAKGVLSDSYRRMDSSPIFGGFVEESLGQGLVPYQGAVTDTRVNLKFLLPQVFTPIEGEHMLFGASLTSSDYGAGRLELSMFLLRLLCTNGMIGASMLKQVHLGRQLDDARISQRTWNLDTKTVTSAIKDMVGNGRMLTEGNMIMQRIKEDSREGGGLNAKKVLEGIQRRGTVTKTEAIAAEKMYEQVMPVEALPQQKGTWRLSNVLSLLAQSQNGDRALDLEREANAVLMGARG